VRFDSYHVVLKRDDAYRQQSVRDWKVGINRGFRAEREMPLIALLFSLHRDSRCLSLFCIMQVRRSWVRPVGSFAVPMQILARLLRRKLR
jgi:hypothetical protein